MWYDTAIAISVTDLNEGSPVFTSTNSLTATAGVPFTFTVRASDVDTADTLTFSSGALPAGVTFTSNTNRTATIAGNNTTTSTGGPFAVTISVTDGNTTTTQAFTITIN
jgi:hypothetical protein